MRLAVVVPCTDSKRPTAAPLRLQDFGGQNSDTDRATKWVDALRTAHADVRVAQIYKGVGWSASLDLVSSARLRASHVTPRVLSAGLGLRDFDDLVPTYSATFVPGHPDSTAARSDDPRAANRIWWSALNVAQGAESPFEQLALTVDGLVVVAAGWYIDAVTDDLAKALAHTPTVVFSSVRPRDARIATVTPAFDRRLREGSAPFVRANDQSLGQRVATAAIEALGPKVTDAQVTSEYLAGHMDRPPPVRHERRAATDEAVAQFIGVALGRDSSATKSQLLRQWRDSGRACEQRRFGQIFTDVQDVLNAAAGSHRVV